MKQTNNRKLHLGVLATLLPLASFTAVIFAHEIESLMDLQRKDIVEVIEGADADSPNNNAPRSFKPCIRGYAGEYPCDKIDQLSHVPSSEMGLTFVNDMWGWTDPETGSDYALVGGGQGLAVVDITHRLRPVVMGLLPTHSTGAFIWRDVKVFANHAFVVSEDPLHGMQVLDLTQLRGLDVSAGPVTFAETAHYDGFSTAHNIGINEDTGYAYVLGSDTCSGGLHMVDITSPTSPSFAGCYSDDGYTHDTQCVIYHGPDVSYQGRELCFNSNAQFSGFSPEGILNTLAIVDVTDKANPAKIGEFEYSNDGYSHQGWLTPDHTYFLHSDELDEFFYGTNTNTRIFDVSNLSAPIVSGVFSNNTSSIDHNIYIEGRYAYASNYTSGLRVYDTKSIAYGELSEVAYFDLYPLNDDASFAGGAWSSYPFFAQEGIVAVSSMDRGLFILQPRIGKD